MNYLILVNKNNRIPTNWKNNIQLVNTKSLDGRIIEVEKDTLDNFNKLKKEANEIGIEIGINEGYRSEEEQEEIQSRLKEIKGIEYVQQYVAEAGYSEHHTALAIDVGLRQNGQLIQENEEGNVKKEIYERLHPLLAKYGFILRYPKGKEEITGYRYEPWHIRYIKDKEKASEIMANNLSLEEYLESKKIIIKKI